MSSKFFVKFCSTLYDKSDRSFVIRAQSRNFAAKKDKCPNKTCGGSKPKSEKSIWNIFSSAKECDEDQEDCVKPTGEIWGKTLAAYSLFNLKYFQP